MEVLIISSIPHVDTLIDVLGCMRVNDVDDHLDSVFMGFIDKFLELVWLSEPGRYTEEI